MNANAMNLTIPRMLGEVSTDTVVRAFTAQQLGRVIDIQRYDRVNENGHAYWFAFIKYVPANTTNARTFVQLLKSGKKTFVFYNSKMPWQMNVQFPVLKGNEKREPFMEVVMHVHELARTNPVALARLPIAVKKGYVSSKTTKVTNKSTTATTQTKRQRRRAICDHDWTTIVRRTTEVEQPVTPTTETEAEPTEADEDDHPEWEFERVPAHPFLFHDTKFDDVEDLNALLRDIDAVRWVPSTVYNANPVVPSTVYNANPVVPSTVYNANPVELMEDPEWMCAWSQILYSC